MRVAVTAPHALPYIYACGVLTALHLRRGGVRRVEEFHNVSTTSPSVSRSMWSPFHRALALVTIFGMVFGGILLVQPTPTSAQSAAVTTDYLNLRTGASTDEGVIAVMPPGSSVSLDGGSQNGFLSLTYNGNWGWAHSDWISVGGSAPTPAPSASGTAYVIDGALNLRSGPSLDNSVITVMPDGAPVSLTGESAGGFLSVVYNGTSGWAYGDYLSAGGSAGPEPTQPSTPGIGDTVVGSMSTTDALNMRSGPGTGYTIITTVANGNTVEIMGDPQNGYYPARYGGNKGWMHGTWLTGSGSSTPAPTPAPSEPAPAPGGSSNLGPGVNARTTTRLNLRTEANTSSTIITTLVNGATVSITGEAQNGFYPVQYGQNSGWMHGEWLTAEGAGDPGPPSEAPAPNPDAPGSVGIGDTVLSEMTVSVGLYLREGPGTNYNPITVMPGGATVQVMGEPQSGWYPLSFHGTKGWASADYLTTGSVWVPDSGNTDYTRDEIIQIIYAAADKYGQPRVDMLRVAQCESVLDPNVVNPASGVSGLFQFLPSTWATTPYANEDIFDPVANAEAAAWMWANGRRNEWHCQ